MRCEVCQESTPVERKSCPTCGSLLQESVHRTLFGVRFVLAQISKWEEQGKILPTKAVELRQEYFAQRDALIQRLKPVPVATRAPVPVPTGADEGIKILSTSPEPVEILDAEIVEPPPPRPVRPPVPVRPRPEPPVRKQFAWRDLFTERNIRWILNLGIFTFSVALALFIHSQWTGMAPVVKSGILVLSTGAAIGLGHVLRRTLLRETGMALIVLGAIALPIDVLGAVQFKLIPASPLVGFFSSAACVGLYVLLARVYRSPVFPWLAVAAAMSVIAFGLATAGIPWVQVPAWSAPFLLAIAAVRGRLPVDFRTPAWLAALPLLYGSVVFSGVFWLGRLGVAMVPMEVALASAVALAVFLRKPATSAIAAVALGGMLWVLIDHVPWEARREMVLSGAFGAGLLISVRWIWTDRGSAHSIPFVALSVLVSALTATAAAWHRDWTALAILLMGNGLVAFAVAAWVRSGALAIVSFLLVGLGIVPGIQTWSLAIEIQPLFLAGYAVLLAVAARAWFREAAIHVSIFVAGAAMFGVALLCLRYYEDRHALGAIICAACAVAFGLSAWRTKFRLVADLAYGSLGFAYVYALRLLQMPPQWLGVAVAFFAMAMFVLQARLRLLRPTLVTGVAAAIGCSALAIVQWLVASKHAPAATTLAMVSAFFLAVGWKTTHRWVLHVGAYVAVAATLCAADGFRLNYAQHVAIVFPLAAATLLVAHRRGELQLGLAGVAILAGVGAFAYLHPDMYHRGNLPWTIAISGAVALLAGYFAFAKPERLDLRVPSGVMGLAATVAYLLFLTWMSTGTPWGGVWVLAMAFLLTGAAWLFRKEPRRSVPLLWVGIAVTVVAAVIGHARGTASAPAYLAVYAAALGLHVAIERIFRRVEFEWSSSVLVLAMGLSLLYFLDPRTSWAGAIVFAAIPITLWVRRRGLMEAGGILLLAACLLFGARRFHDPWAGAALLGMALVLLPFRRPELSFLPCATAVVTTWRHPDACALVLGAMFAAYLGVALWRRKASWVTVAVSLAAIGVARFLLEHWAEPRVELWLLLPLAAFLGSMLFVRERLGEMGAVPLLALTIGTALASTVSALGQPLDRIAFLLADTALFAVLAYAYRQPVYLYLASVSFVALDVAVLSRFGVPPTITAVQLLTLALIQVVCTKAAGERFRAYSTPIFLTGLVVAGGVLVFGFWNHRAYTTTEIRWAIWGMMMAALVYGVAGRIRGISWLYYLAAGHLLGAYYLTLHKYGITTLEFYTVPIGVSLAVWSLFVGREDVRRRILEGVALGAYFAPSAVASFLPNGAGHTLAALVLAFLGVLAGMVLRRRIFVFGATGGFAFEVVAKTAELLVRMDLSLAQWGMGLGLLMILVAGLFESRKLRFVKDRAEGVKANAAKVLAKWD